MRCNYPSIPHDAYPTLQTFRRQHTAFCLSNVMPVAYDEGDIFELHIYFYGVKKHINCISYRDNDVTNENVLC